MRRIASTITVVAAALAAACGKSSTDVTSTNAASIVALGGTAQSDTVVATVHDSLVVKVADQAGNPLPGATVSWTATQGGGSFNTTSTRTDAAGRSAVAWTFGITSGPQAATATVGALAPVTFTGFARPGAPASMAYSGDAQSAAARTTLAAPLLVVIRDKWGNLVPGVAIAWSVTAGGGSLGAASVTTDSTGQASVTWTLGPAGAQAARASRDSLVHTFTATAF